MDPKLSANGDKICRFQSIMCNARTKKNAKCSNSKYSVDKFLDHLGELYKDMKRA